MEYVTWNQFNAASIKQAEQRKQKLEKDGWTLVHSTIGCLTYNRESQEDYPDDWYNEDDNGESDSDRYMDELDQEPPESKTDYCDRMGFDM